MCGSTAALRHSLVHPPSTGLPNGAVGVKNADDINSLDETVALPFAERVDADLLSGW
jgi:hypothetical protein